MKREPRFPLLSARSNWIFIEILTIFFIILGCTVLVWWKESSVEGQTGYETFKNVVNIVGVLSYRVVIYVVCIFEIIGEIMIRYTYLLHKATEKGIEQGKAEGKAEGIAEERHLWINWNNRRLAAEAKGEDFSEPPPVQSTEEEK